MQRINRTIRACLLPNLLLLFCSNVQIAYGQKDKEPDVVVELTVTPAAEALPAFRHRFTVLPHKTEPGNAAVTYLGAMAETNLSNLWKQLESDFGEEVHDCLLYTSPSPRDLSTSRMPSSA